MAEMKSWDEREHYVGAQQSSAIHTKKVTAETSEFEQRLFDKQDEIASSVADKESAKYNKQAWANVEGDIQSQLDALIEFDENVWKQDVLLQAGDTWTAYKWGSNLDTLGIFSGDDVATIDLVPDTNIDIDTDLNFSNSYNPPKIG